MSQKKIESEKVQRPLQKVKVQKLSTGIQSQLALDRPKGLGDSFSITVATGNHTVSYTVHRPIGVTDLDDDDWVVTPVGDIQSLLSRAVDPAQGEINKMRGVFKTSLLIESGLLIKDAEKGITYPVSVYTGEKDRNALLNEADTTFSEHKKTRKEEYKKSHPNATQDDLDRIKFDKSRVDFLTDELRLHERKIAEFLSSEPIRRKIEEHAPQTYRTRSGPLMDRNQVACTVIGKTKTITMAEDRVNSWLYAKLVAPTIPENSTATKDNHATLWSDEPVGKPIVPERPVKAKVVTKKKSSTSSPPATEPSPTRTSGVVSGLVDKFVGKTENRTGVFGNTLS